MSIRLGIGVITYNRRDSVLETLQRVRTHTRLPHALVVADDGSIDGTREAVLAPGLTLITGRNMGVAWNKNRALFHLLHTAASDVVILLEDDSYPDADGWEADWIAAAQAWGHVNLAGAWFANSFITGSGTATDPVLSTNVSGQCSAFSRNALAFGGFMDTRFRGYGFEHVEHSRRLIRIGYGGHYEPGQAGEQPIFKLIRGGITVTHPLSHGTPDGVARNQQICAELLHDQSYRAPWRDDGELAQFRAEMAAARTGA